MIRPEIDELGKVIWNYLNLHETLDKSDAIFCLCSIDTRVAERAAQLVLDGYGEHVIFSGGFGPITRDRFDKPEAEVFADIALAMGVPSNKIIVENKSTNTGENVQFTYSLLTDRQLSPQSLILVQKPYMERRTYATFRKQWPDSNTKIAVTSPQIDYDDYFNEENPKERVLSIMVGDLQRIKEYPAYGFQIEQAIPDNIWAAYEALVSLGYTNRLIK